MANSKPTDPAHYIMQAKRWASYATRQKREGLPWVDCARIAKANLDEARKLVTHSI